ncbi:hypothetical protein H0H87_003265 [Tephrocybe sp. NHM501043]|nr:hypothetical protein H0H87_003265 [Tephrocybe sp. NHM501043]
MSNIPLDIFENILDDLLDDRVTLSRLSLVSRVLIEPAQRRLFRAINIAEMKQPPYKLFLTLKSSRTLETYIQSLSWDISELFPCSSLPNLHTLSINPGSKQLHHWDRVEDWVRTTITGLVQSPQLKELSIRNVDMFPLTLLSNARLEILKLDACNPLITNESDIGGPLPPLSHRILGPSQIKHFTFSHAFFTTARLAQEWPGWQRLVSDLCVTPSLENVTLPLSVGGSREGFDSEKGSSVYSRSTSGTVISLPTGFNDEPPASYFPDRRLPWFSKPVEIPWKGDQNSAKGMSS